MASVLDAKQEIIYANIGINRFSFLSSFEVTAREISNQPVREKTNNLGSYQVRHNIGCTGTEDGYRLEIWIYTAEEFYYPCSENKGADQLRSYCEADLRLCFRLCWFSHAAAQLLRPSVSEMPLSIAIIQCNHLLQSYNSLWL